MTIDSRVSGGEKQKIFCHQLFSEAFASNIPTARHSHITMAAVYKTVFKKKARQSTEDMDEDSDIPMDELLEDADDTSDSEEEDEVEDRIAEARRQLAAGMMPKTRVLILTSRGVTHRSVLSINALQ